MKKFFLVLLCLSFVPAVAEAQRIRRGRRAVERRNPPPPPITRPESGSYITHSVDCAIATHYFLVGSTFYPSNTNCGLLLTLSNESQNGSLRFGAFTYQVSGVDTNWYESGKYQLDTRTGIIHFSPNANYPDPRYSYSYGTLGRRSLNLATAGSNTLLQQSFVVGQQY